MGLRWRTGSRGGQRLRPGAGRLRGLWFGCGKIVYPDIPLWTSPLGSAYVCPSLREMASSTPQPGLGNAVSCPSAGLSTEAKALGLASSYLSGPFGRLPQNPRDGPVGQQQTLLVLEAGSLRWRCWHGRALGRPLPGSGTLLAVIYEN